MCYKPNLTMSQFKMSSSATPINNTSADVDRSVVSNEIDAVEVEFNGKTYFVEEETTKVFDAEGEFKGFLGRGEFKTMTLPKDEDEVCECCNTTRCEDDEDYDERELWVSNTTGKNICRACVWKEEQEEDEHRETCEEEHCKICSRGVFCDCWDKRCPWCCGNGKEWWMKKDFMLRVKAGKTEEEALADTLVEYA